MSHIIDVPVNGGYVTTGTGARSADKLGSGELVTMQSAYYKKNDPDQAWKMPGRSLFGSAGSTGIKGLAICQFDEGGTDKLVASVGTSYVGAVPSPFATFSDLVTGLDSRATRFTACHQDDRWYLGNGYDQNRVLQPDGTTRLMSMQRPGRPTAVGASPAHAVSRPTASTGDWTTPANAYDADIATSASGTVFPFTTLTQQQTYTGFAADATPDRTLKVYFQITRGYGEIDCKIEKFDEGVWSDVYHTIIAAPHSSGPGWAEVPVTSDNSNIQVRVTISSPFGIATFYVYDIKIEYGSVSSGISTTLGGIYYAVTEVVLTEGPAGDGGLQSEPSLLFGPLSLASVGAVTVTRTATANPAATHWRVWRIGDGVGNTYDNLGQVSGDIAIADLAWTDNLADVLITEQASPIIPLVVLGDQLYFRDSPAQVFVNMISWRSSIVGISRTNRRQLAYSDGGRPESFPSIYVVESFPLDEHDGLVGQMAVGETLVLLCEGAVLAIEDLPRVTDGVFDPGRARPLKGHPGCVGGYAYTTFSVAGESRGAWVSPFGVYITNGQTCACISTDLEWELELNPAYLGNAVLRWDQKNQILWFQFDTDGDGRNDREMPFHMAEKHAKGETTPKLGQPTPKATSIMASALISAQHYRFSGHPTDGNVYLEESGTIDAATGATVQATIKTGQLSAQMVDSAVQKVTVGHTDFGSGQTALLTATFYRDTANSSQTKSATVRLDGNRGTTVGMGRAGELVDFEVVTSGTGLGAISGLTLEVDGQGRSGSAPRWVSATATP